MSTIEKVSITKIKGGLFVDDLIHQPFRYSEQIRERIASAPFAFGPDWREAGEEFFAVPVLCAAATDDFLMRGRAVSESFHLGLAAPEAESRRADDRHFPGSD